MTKITWVGELPPPLPRGTIPGKRRSIKDQHPIYNDRLVKALRDRPGDWALVQMKTANAKTITDFVKRHPGIEYATRSSYRGATRKSKSGNNIRVFNVYMRYNPQAAAPAGTTAETAAPVPAPPPVPESVTI